MELVLGWRNSACYLLVGLPGGSFLCSVLADARTPSILHIANYDDGGPWSLMTRSVRGEFPFKRAELWVGLQ